MKIRWTTSLFESKQGFCNYYASAEVLMLRSIGIPARLAVGFAQGEPNLQNTFFTVREKDAHAWPEVYFPGYGWIEFEPTGNQDPVNRPVAREEKPVINLDALDNQPELDALAQEEPQTPIPLELQTSGFPTRVQIIELSIAGTPACCSLTGFLLKRRFAPNIQTSAILKNVVERNGWETPAWLTRWTLWSALSPIQNIFTASTSACVG
ncbi:MAG: transglutaminase domain-containing protein [Anaerolineales bacterium]|nr:transglutaminase domain-containing protein [Anaerolineales bacterium]